MDKWEYYDFLNDVKNIGQNLDFIHFGIAKTAISNMFFEERLDKRIKEVYKNG